MIYNYSLLMRSIHGFIDLMRIYRPMTKLIYSHQVYNTMKWTLAVIRMEPCIFVNLYFVAFFPFSKNFKKKSQFDKFAILHEIVRVLLSELAEFLY